MDLKAGIYEEVISERVAAALVGIESDLTQISRLDPGDADTYLSRY